MRRFRFKVVTVVRALLMVAAVGAVVEIAAPQHAEARAGRGRSSGYQRSQPQPQRQVDQRQAANAAGQPLGAQPNRSNFMRNMAGGIAGGFLGSMLFSSIGQAAGMGGHGGGGIGILEIALFAGIAYFGFRWWKARQLQPAPAFGMSSARQQGEASFPSLGTGAFDTSAQSGDTLTADDANDLFFKIQGAWTRRDLTPARGLLTEEMRNVLGRDIEDLKRERRINRLENITLRRTEILSSGRDGGIDLAQVLFTANLLDYTVDESSGAIVEGSDAEPVKFEEEWTFSKAADSPRWQLAGIRQV